jgi:flagellum-specific ATP synthase
MDRAFDVQRYLKVLDNKYSFTLKGVIKQAIGLTLEARGPKVSLGELCYAQTNKPNKDMVPCEVVGFKDDKILLMPLGDTEGIGPGSELFMTGKSLSVNVGVDMVGRVLNGLGELMDEGGRINYQGVYPVMNTPPNPLSRKLITEALPVGVKAIDALLTIGKGQRMGIFAGSGVGKSTLMGMIARNTTADVNVIALVGERGREVREFLENDLGPEGLARSVVVVATSDQPALVRLKGAYVATSIAEFFRDQGKDVLLLMDSLTRLALAQREVGLAIGEPPTTRGYPPSVFALLPKLLERAGTSSEGTITGLYTVLVEGDDLNEPVTDTVRGIIDGHIILSRKIAAQNQYPSIDVLSSVSRVMPQVMEAAQMDYARQFRTILANYEDAKDLIDIGAYKPGANPKVDEAIRLIGPCTEFIRQGTSEKIDFTTALTAVQEIFEK